ncbi:MAG: hypothetical protein KY444_03690 [Gemmatimonadetes bacterium]|nr:hypothetical protein [Gemmatimonadota bacterium]
MFRVHMLPAGHGDCLWIEYGDPAAPRRILIDGGTAPTYKLLRARLRALPEGDRAFELAVVTHVDADHIAGMVRLLNDDGLGLAARDFWFNDLAHMPADALGSLQGEFLSALLEKRGIPWNQEFDGGPVVVDDHESPPGCTLPGGMRLTVLSPTPSTLAEMAEEWADTVRKEGIDPGDRDAALRLLSHRRDMKAVPADALGGLNVGALAAEPYSPDDSAPNGSSIAFLAEYDGAACLFLGDAHPPVVEAALDSLLAERGLDRLPLSALKVSHHASKGNVSARLLEQVQCAHYLISTNGKYYGHPHPQAVARIVDIADEPTLWFNYQGKAALDWDDGGLKDEYGYRTEFPPDATQPGMVVDLHPGGATRADT